MLCLVYGYNTSRTARQRSARQEPQVAHSAIVVPILAVRTSHYRFPIAAKLWFLLRLQCAQPPCLRRAVLQQRSPQVCRRKNGSEF